MLMTSAREDQWEDGMAVGRGRAWGVGLGVFASVCFGGSGTVGKALVDAGASPLQATWIRVVGAALLLVPIALIARRRAVLETMRRAPRLLVLYGLTGVAGSQACYFVAAARLPVGVAILLEYMGPVLVVAWIRFVRRVAVPASAGAGVVIALVGLACVVQIWSGLRLDGIGMLAGLCAAGCQASYFLILDRMGEDADPITMTAGGLTVAAVALTAVASPWAIHWHILAAEVPLGSHQVPGWALAAWVAVVCTVVAYITGAAAVQRLSAPVAGGVGYVEAVSAALIAWAVLGQSLGPIQLAGGAVVLLGAYVAQRAVTAPEPAPAEPTEPAPVTAPAEPPEPAPVTPSTVM
jgi:drug/metabolite transporter (DMT)-like permease